MTLILLPGTPLPKSATERPIDYGSWQTPIAGGVITRLDRPGNRTAVDFVTPDLKPEPDARIWSSRLRQAVGRLVRARFVQPWRDPASPSYGIVTINGTPTSAAVLPIRGAVAGLAIVEGQALNVFDAGGAAHIHFSTANVIVGGDGTAGIPITPWLRAVPADGSPVGLDEVLIDGQLSGNDKGWTQVRAKTQGLSYTVTEVR